MIDLGVPIVPGKSAGGFTIGNSLDQVCSHFESVKVWTRASGEQLQAAIRSTMGWLDAPLKELGGGQAIGHIFYFGGGVLQLHFNSTLILSGIVVFEGYRGSLLEGVSVGEPLSNVLKICAIEYDDVDEMHYPVPESGLEGVAFIAEERSLDDSPGQTIAGISVFDRSL